MSMVITEDIDIELSKIHDRAVRAQGIVENGRLKELYIHVKGFRAEWIKIQCKSGSGLSEEDVSAFIYGLGLLLDEYVVIANRHDYLLKPPGEKPEVSE